MAKSLRILVYADRYATGFVTPRASRHTIIPNTFIPLSLISSKLEGLAIVKPAVRVDLMHAFNRIPLNTAKFVITFESHLPRHFGVKRRSWLAHCLMGLVADSKCRRIIALSHYAKRIFLRQHSDSPAIPLLRDKLLVRHPSVVIPPEDDAMQETTADELTLTFVGSHFGRKGGCVAVKMAEKALERGLPIRVNIVSSLQVGGRIWTDPTDRRFFDTYLKLLDLPNVCWLDAQPNDRVRELLRHSHFSLLTTFGDTFGYSAVESMAEHTPVIGTTISALPEFIEDGLNGIMLPVRVNAVGEWWNPGYNTRGSERFASHFRDEVERLASLALDRLSGYVGQPDRLAALRREARKTAETMFASEAAGRYLDNLYERVCEESTERPARLDAMFDVSSASRYAGSSIPDDNAP